MASASAKTRKTKATMISGGNLSSKKFSGRLIPKRGQVKLAIVVGLLQSFSSVFSSTSNCTGALFS